MFYGRLGPISRRKGIQWERTLFSPVHCFLTSKDGSLDMATSLCGKVTARSYTVVRTWTTSSNCYIKEVGRDIFNSAPCYYCEKKHQELLIAERMMVEEKNG